MKTKREYLASLETSELNDLLELIQTDAFKTLISFFELQRSELSDRIATEEIVETGKFSASEFALYKIGIANGTTRFINKLRLLEMPLKAELKRREQTKEKKEPTRKSVQTIYQSI